MKDGREAANRKTAKARVRMREGVRAQGKRRRSLPMASIPSTNAGQPKPTQGRRQPCQLSLGRRYWARERAQGVGEDSASLVMVAWVVWAWAVPDARYLARPFSAIVSDPVIRPLELLGLLGLLWFARARCHPLSDARTSAHTRRNRGGNHHAAAVQAPKERYLVRGAWAAKNELRLWPTGAFITARCSLGDCRPGEGARGGVPSQRWLACQRE